MPKLDEEILTAEQGRHLLNVAENDITQTHKFDAAYRWMYGIPKRMKEYVPSQEEVEKMIEQLLNLKPNVVNN